MGKFSWAQGHHKQGSGDKQHILPTEWFSKTPAEPSRQALNELVKEHMAAEGDRTVIQTRSRSGTVSSVMSHYAKSSSDHSGEVKSRPGSRQSIIEVVPRSPGRQEPVSRSLFSKGSRIMRRKTSKLTLLPSRAEGVLGDGRRDIDPTKLELAAQLLNLSPKREFVTFPGQVSQLTSKGTPTKSSISGPFGFQHVTHTDQGQYQSLNSVTKTDFESDFSALQAGQQPAAEIRGIAVEDLPSSSPSTDQQDFHQPQSPTSSIMPGLPSTPPRPEPPPKDLLSQPTTPDMKLSRSVENFSRPNRSPGFGIDVSPVSTMPAEDPIGTSGPMLSAAPPSPLSWAEATNDSLSNISSRRQSAAPAHLLDKPLPLPPTIVHAVSTADDSALPLRTAPLPQLPSIPSPGAEEAKPANIPQTTERRPSTPHRASLRHMQTFPSGKAARRRSQSSGEIPFGFSASAFALISPVAPQVTKPKKRTSIGIKKIDIEDWEDAIDYSWDHPPDLDDELELDTDQAAPTCSSPTVTNASPTLTSQLHANRPMPLTLTPVMEHQASDDPQVDLPLQSPTTGRSDETGPVTQLQGLGIESVRPPTAIQVDADRFSEQGDKRESLRIPAIRRDPGSPISKSSSQESIILSIASSIMSTQRSSNSSTSLSDLSHLASIDDEATLPSDDAMPRADSVEGNTSDSSQETVTTEPKSASTPCMEFPSPPSGKIPSPTHQHERGTSISRIHVPNRTSSIAAGAMTKLPPTTSRQRSNTLNGRPKNIRVSYSLFPAPPPPPPSART